MKRIASLLLLAALFEPAARAGQVLVSDAATVVTSAVSRAFRLDTRESPFASDGSETLTWSSEWFPVGNGSVTIFQDGAALSNAQGVVGEGVCEWRVDRDGIYVLSHATMREGGTVANETATFVVDGVTPAVEPTLRWKYARNANGWYCAQVALTWRTGYDTVLSDMRLLFADRTNAEGRRSAYLVDPATAIDPVAATEEHEGTTYRAVPIDLAPFAAFADGARAVVGVSDATLDSPLDSVPAAERAICLRVANRDIATVGSVSNKLAILAWKKNGADVFLPISESLSYPRQSMQHAAFGMPGPAPRPVTVDEANLAASFALPAGAVARGSVTCRVSSMSFGEDGSMEGTFAVGAEDAGGVLAEGGELSPGVAFEVLGAASLGGSFEPLDPAACGVELRSRKPPYAFRVKAPGDKAFFNARLEAEDVYE